MLNASKEYGYYLGQAEALDYMGKAYYALGQYGRAVQLHQQALLIFDSLKNQDKKLNALINLGNSYYSLGEYTRAIQFYQTVSKLYKSNSDYRAQADILVDLGNAYLNLGQDIKAIEFLQQSLSVFKKIKAYDRYLKVLIILSDIYKLRGENTQTSELNHEIFILAKDIVDIVSEDFGDSAKRCGSRSVWELAELERKWDQRGFSFVNQICNTEWRLNMAMSLGDAYVATTQYEQAIKLYINVSLYAQSPLRAKASLNIGNAYFALKEYDAALKYYEKAFTLFEKNKDLFNKGKVLSNTGLIHLQSNKPIAAQGAFQEAILIWESLREGLTDEDKVSLFETQIATYRFLQQALILQKKFESALEAAERGRARAFVEFLAKRLNSQSSDASNHSTIKPPNIQQIRQIARAQNATLVQYSVFPLNIGIWVIKPNGEVIFQEINLKSTPSSSLTQLTLKQLNASESELTQVVASTRRSLGVVPANPQAAENLTFQADPAEMSRQLKQLHQLLIEPIADLLPTDPDQPVIFIPQGPLFLVPFPALRDANGKYLIEKHTILTAPSIQVLDLTRQQKSRVAGSKGALIVGNPVMPKGLAPLPDAEKEAKAIAPLFNTQPLLGAQATKATVMQKMPQARIIHLATHGLLDDVRGLGSAIALAPSGKDDGLLTAEEILDMKLNADLVVLSACNTGRGRITGDGIVGLSRSLIAAGTPSVLASLWSMPDDSTAMLMTEFYQNLQRQPNKARALRQAMLTTKKVRPGPFDWAAFTLIGEAE